MMQLSGDCLKTKIRQFFSNDLLKKGASDSSYYLMANIGSKLLGLLVIPVLAKTISVEEFASYDLFLVVGNFLQIFVTLGIDSGIAVLLAQSQVDRQKLSFYYVSTLFISFVSLLLITVLVNSIFVFVDQFFLLDQTFWFLIIGFAALTIIKSHTFNFLKWKGDAKKAAFINLFSYIFGVVLGLLFLYLKPQIESYIEGLMIGALLGSLMSLYIAREYIFNFKILENYKELLIELFKLSLPFVPNYLGANLMRMADRIVILMLFGKYELGLYAVIMRLAMIPQFLSSTITGGFLPVMYHNYKTEKGAKLIKGFFHAYIVLIPVLFMVAYLLSDWAVGLFAGEEYMKIAYLFPMALVSILFVNSSQVNGLGYTIARKTHYIMYITFLSIVLSFVFSLVFGYGFGIAGVIFGTLLAGIVRTYMHTKYSEKLYCFHYSFLLITVCSLITLLLSAGSYFWKF